ncbi:MAG: UDP-3-O-(3-hydroxymyristoyl)glucosamine N-acyltransferase [Alphaproteobacteria bacterium]|nr:UDP-3-O-(3-hydroxymyristoyl)glucosamine N-acyltransferase [Alphaproteobacteria bacterium]
MADPRFFDNHGPFAIAQIASSLGATLEGAGNRMIADTAPLARAAPAHLSFCETAKFKNDLARTQAGAVLVREEMKDFVPASAVALVVRDPLYAYARIARLFYPQADGLHAPTAGFAVHPTAVLHDDIAIEHGAVIAEGTEIGPRSRIGAGAIIGRGVAMGADCVIGPGATVFCAYLGDRVIVHAGARIGQDGFGYARGPGGHVKIPQLGRVILQDDVEVGANTTIDRGAAADTVVGEGTKIDNLVQIGHNTHIGRACILVSQVGLSGSITIGDGVVLGGKVGVADHVTIGSGAMVAARAGVTRDLPAGGVYGGFPARPAAEWRREVAALARLAKGKRKP